MKASLLKTGVICLSTDNNKEDILFEGNPEELKVLLDYSQSLKIEDNEVRITNSDVLDLFEKDFDYYADLLEICLKSFNNLTVQFIVNEWDDHNEYSFFVIK